MTNTTSDLLRLTDVSKIYGDLHALDHVDLTVRRGEWVSIVGPSGSGKTTMMNIIGCMDQPTEGTVMLDGRDISKFSGFDLTQVRRETIGLIFQQFHLIPHLTALENVMVAQYYHSMPDETEALAALDRVGLAERATHLPSQLSGGEQQRVCVARALINSPKIVLADEPTGNLDEKNERIVLDIFGQLHAEGTTLIVVTHDAWVASKGQREVRLDHGRIVETTVHDDAGAGGDEPAQSNVVMTGGTDQGE
ncbi:MAG: ABC transporter ATP-binding protein [Propionibacteriaceae bacterium]|uniref:Adenosinetriphosphatase n=1 Tax=Propionibacterium ruminifibrarum TaxID=1962131 RepID=A0A375I3Z5_9ACTN|nr:ABC transporter ATP-binding protein [Propionibacterium ruminifibrarum]MBE6478235.1 ABC transporter ATP-binding protein [Propionibacteriaceae bacterium]SPF68768.1 adenosinetriphosphatase [Propionibacterium ruminifibrarum]